MNRINKQHGKGVKKTPRRILGANTPSFTTKLENASRVGIHGVNFLKIRFYPQQIGF